MPTDATQSRQAHESRHPGVAASASGSRVGFFLFLMVNALLFVRPGDLFPWLKALHPYELLMLVCLVIYLPQILPQLRMASLRARPITAMVLCVLAFVLLTILIHGYMDLLQDPGLELAKIVLYYLLLTASIRDVPHLHRFVVFLAACLALVGLQPVLEHHGLIHLSTVQSIVDVKLDPLTGKQILFDRLTGVGIFEDPNDLAQILGVGIILCLYAVQQNRSWLVRGLWAAPIMVMLYAIYLTQSRGGLMGFGVGMMVLFVSRFGWRKAAILGVVAMPALLMVFGGRQTAISTEEGSAQARVRLWAEAFDGIKGNPLTGLGAGAMGEYYMNQVAHNTFIHMFGELGLIGGSAFLGAYWISVWGLVRMHPGKVELIDPELRALRPFLGAALATYAMGMMSLSRGYVLPTYTLLGLTTVFFVLVRTRPEMRGLRLDGRLIRNIATVAAVFLVVMYLFVATKVRWSGG